MAKKKAANPAPSAKREGKKTAAKPTSKPDAKKKGGAWDAVLAPRSPGEKRYWLVKSEPEVFSFDDLLKRPNKTTHWDGVRNFAARNFMRDGMKVGDRVFYYHSMTDAQSIVGICEVTREAYPDPSANDPKSPAYDPKSDPSHPTWYMVDLRAVAQFTHPVTLSAIKAKKELKDMVLLRIGRLSVQPVSAAEWATICAMAEA